MLPTFILLTPLFACFSQPHLQVEAVSGVLGKKTREGIKEQYSGFNDGLEAAVKLQKDLSVPSKVGWRRVDEKSGGFSDT